MFMHIRDNRLAYGLDVVADSARHALRIAAANHYRLVVSDDDYETTFELMKLVPHSYFMEVTSSHEFDEDACRYALEYITGTDFAASGHSDKLLDEAVRITADMCREYMRRYAAYEKEFEKILVDI